MGQEITVRIDDLVQVSSCIQVVFERYRPFRRGNYIDVLFLGSPGM